MIFRVFLKLLKFNYKNNRPKYEKLLKEQCRRKVYVNRKIINE